MELLPHVRRLWGDNIFAARTAAGFGTQTAFAAAIGASQGTVSKWEQGDEIPRDHWKVAIAEATGREVRDLFPLTRGMAQRGRVA